MMMKRFVCVLVVLMMVAGVALACDCAPSATVRMTAMQMADMNLGMTADEMEAVSVIALGENGECSEIKGAMLMVTVRNWSALVERFGVERMGLVLTYLGHCCCDDGCGEIVPNVTQSPVVTPAPTVRPTQQSQRPQTTPRACVHEGGNHDNRGMCSLCGQIYQDHSTPGEWQSNNGTWHDRFCSFPGCGVKMGNGRHVWDGVTYATSAEGLKKVMCTVCHQYSWIRIGSTQVNVTENHNNGCCGCCNGEVCQGECGCGCEEE